MKKLRITVGEKVYEVTVESLDETGRPSLPAAYSRPVVSSASVSPSAASPSKPHAHAAPAGPGDVASPLAGKIMSVAVEVGAQVAQGDLVATIEAMKMNTFVHATKAGKVTAVKVNAGDAVQEGDVLLTIE